jgi:hypothetical protein
MSIVELAERWGDGPKHRQMHWSDIVDPFEGWMTDASRRILGGFVRRRRSDKRLTVICDRDGWYRIALGGRALPGTASDANLYRTMADARSVLRTRTGAP